MSIAGKYLVVLTSLQIWNAPAQVPTSDSLNKALLIAAEKGQLDMVKELLAKGASANARTEGGVTVLTGAAAFGRIEIVNVLIEKGADVHAVNRAGVTPLMWAAVKGHVDVVLALIAGGANLEARDRQSDTTLMQAARAGQTAVVLTLAAKTTEIDAKNNSGSTALIQAAAKGHAAVLKALFAHGANANAADDTGSTALMYAAGAGHAAAVETLLANGADVNAKNKAGVSVLDLAASKAHGAIVKVLIARGATLNDQAASARGVPLSPATVAPPTVNGWGKGAFGKTPQELAALFQRKLPKKFSRSKKEGTISWFWDDLTSEESCVWLRKRWTEELGVMSGAIKTSVRFTADAANQGLIEVSYFPPGCVAGPNSGREVLRGLTDAFWKKYGRPTAMNDLRSVWEFPSAEVSVNLLYSNAFMKVGYYAHVVVKKLPDPRP